MPQARERHADIVVVGGGTGGCAAALAALRLGRTVIMTEETEWIGGQFTSQAVPPDENAWIEYYPPTASYGDLRRRIRDFYRRNFPLSDHAQRQAYLNPGHGPISPLCCEPRAALAAFTEMLAPYTHSGRLTILTRHAIEEASTAGDRITSATVRNACTGDRIELVGRYVLDATECGDVLPLAGVEHVTGAESRDETDEPHAASGPARPDTMLAFTWCMVLDRTPGEDQVIDRPATYDYFRTHVPEGWIGPQLSWKVQNFDVTGIDSGQDAQPPADVPPMDRRIADMHNFADGLYSSDVVCFNHAQNVYMGGPAFGPDMATHREMARQLSLSVVYWLQTEAPRLDGGQGYPGVRLRPDVVGTEDGLAMAPYIRESRRIRAELTVREQDITGEECDRRGAARPCDDSVGIMHYFIDMWPSTEGQQPFLLPAYPAQVPMGSLIPVRVRNLLPACKNAGFTQITASAYRMHPGEWAIGEAAGALAAYCVEHDIEPRQVRGNASELAGFQSLLERLGIATRWPDIGPIRTWDGMVTAWRQFGRMDRSVLLPFPH